MLLFDSTKLKRIIYKKDHFLIFCLSVKMMFNFYQLSKKEKLESTIFSRNII